MKWSLLLSIVVLSMVASTAPAQGPATIDHYYVYLLTQPIPLPVPQPRVILNDQWGVSSPLDVLALEKFANPVDKNGEGILNFDLHYSWYRIDEPNVGRIVQVKNQFDPADGTNQVLFVTNAKYLLTPSTKNGSDPLAVIGVNHYKCYDARGSTVNRPVFLQDQWGNSTAMVLEPECFCNPVAKEHDGVFYPIEDPFAHLTCYKILGGHDGLPATITDQFLQVSISNSTPCLLCVPSDKLSTVPTEESTWGKIKSLYR